MFCEDIDRTTYPITFCLKKNESILTHFQFIFIIQIFSFFFICLRLHALDMHAMYQIQSLSAHYFHASKLTIIVNDQNKN